MNHSQQVWDFKDSRAILRSPLLSNARETNRSRGGRPRRGLDPGLIAAIPPGSVSHCGAADCAHRAALHTLAAQVWCACGKRQRDTAVPDPGRWRISSPHPVIREKPLIMRQRNRHDRSVSRLIRQGAQTTKKYGSICNVSIKCYHARAGSIDK